MIDVRKLRARAELAQDNWNHENVRLAIIEKLHAMLTPENVIELLDLIESFKFQANAAGDGQVVQCNCPKTDCMSLRLNAGDKVYVVRYPDVENLRAAGVHE